MGRAPRHHHECADCYQVFYCEVEHPFVYERSAPLGCDPPLSRDTWFCDACSELDARQAAQETD